MKSSVAYLQIGFARVSRSWVWMMLLIGMGVGIGTGSGGVAQAAAGDVGGVNTIAFPWLEPRGINIVDLVGLVPEEHLRDTTVAFSYHGSLRYLAGQRNGEQVTVNVAVVPQYQQAPSGDKTSFNCVGQWAVFDQWPAPVVASEMRLFEGGVDVTDQVEKMLYFPAVQGIPLANTTWIRYPEVWWQDVVFADSGAVQVPANMGCFFLMSGQRSNLTAQFVMKSQPAFLVDYLGSEGFTTRSYLGPGAAGHVESLRTQLQARFGNKIRHDKFALNPPAGAEYILLKYPLTPIGPYAEGDIDANVRLPSSGTYRLAFGTGGSLSVDHTASMALPIYQQWRDADISPGHEYLPRVRNINTLASPEYFVLPGTAYDPCMTNGGCPDWMLDSIFNATAELTVYYYAIRRTVVGLDRVPLRQVGPDYETAASLHMADLTALITYPAMGDETRPSQSAPPQNASSPESEPQLSEESQVPDGPNAPFVLYMPLIAAYQDPYVTQPDDPTGCPCGWFDKLGRMVDVVSEGAAR